ncbi:hypothetical protein Q8W37_19285 [Shimia thalassica]|uniref:hypothetical protein n=1 Tax=Shimia thalassica TaxID=1715693 RepID=UPI00273485F8|nr:hypothetical protein [Shimia thalassica]MDP2582091.1 hypothetical protein [Shimia thalassica]
MIIKSSRVQARHGEQIARYLEDQGENELVSWALGDAEDIALMSLIAQYSNKLFGVRHFVIAPGKDLSIFELQTTVRDVYEEYDVTSLSQNQACLVMHQKPRSRAGVCDVHFHLAVAELDPGSGRVMCSRFTKMRDEKIARILELKFGHPPILGRFNRAVYNAIQREQPDLDLTPFEGALKSAAAAQGLPAKSWKDVKAFAPNIHAQKRQGMVMEQGLTPPFAI